ncbi:MAG: hypothetical protein ACJ8GO_07155 [Ramlibacter sp.]
MEHIAGPILGFYLACYTIEAHEGHFAYAKICLDQPLSVWDAADCVLKVGAGPFPTPEEALIAVMGRSERRIVRREARRNSGWLVLDSRPHPLNSTGGSS